MSEENEFIDWQGGECPVDPDTIVEVMLSNGSVVVNRRAGGFDWQRGNYGGDIIAYRVVKDIRPKVEIPEGFTPWLGVVERGALLGVLPEGFTPWLGGERPFDIWHHVEVIFDDGTGGFWRAGELRWNYDKNLVRNIIAYRDEFEDKKPQTARDTQVGGDHYKKAGIQPWDVVDTWPIEQQIGFHRGNALKYVMRMGTKDENLREIRKAAHYLQKLVEVLEQKGGV